MIFPTRAITNPRCSDDCLGREESHLDTRELHDVVVLQFARLRAGGLSIHQWDFPHYLKVLPANNKECYNLMVVRPDIENYTS